MATACNASKSWISRARQHGPAADLIHLSHGIHLLALAIATSKRTPGGRRRWFGGGPLHETIQQCRDVLQIGDVIRPRELQRRLRHLGKGCAARVLDRSDAAALTDGPQAGSAVALRAGEHGAHRPVAATQGCRAQHRIDCRTRIVLSRTGAERDALAVDQ
jgi:hypothetical protein